MLKKSLLRSAPALRFPCFAWVPARALLARAFAGTIPAFRNPCSTWVPAQAIRGLGVRRGEGSLDLRLVPPHPPDCCLSPARPPDLHLLPPHPLDLYLVPLRPWTFPARKAKSAILLLHPRLRKRYVRVPLLSIFQMLNAFAKWQHVPVPPSRVLFQHPARHQTICRVTNPGSLG